MIPHERKSALKEYSELEKLAERSVASSTLSMYRGRINVIKRFSIDAGCNRITKEAFGSFLSQLADTGKPSIQFHYTRILQCSHIFSVSTF